MKNKELLLEISYKCNLHCIHCSSIDCTEKITLDNISRNINLDEINVVRISGGEPTLLNDLSKYIKFFYNRGIKIILQTNGTKKIDDETFNMINEIWLSIYGEENLHNFIVGDNDAYKKAKWYFEKSVIIQSPIFNYSQILSLFNNNNIWRKKIRLFALLNHGRCNFALPIKKQLKIVKRFEKLPIWNYLDITCSIDPIKCNYENKLVLKPDGKLFNCASHKHGLTICKK